MCAAANGWVGIGRIVYASSSRQLMEWLKEFGRLNLPFARFPLEKWLLGSSSRGRRPSSPGASGSFSGALTSGVSGFRRRDAGVVKARRFPDAGGRIAL